MAKAAGPNDLPAFLDACERTICRACGNQDLRGRCAVRSSGDCCLYRYLPLVYEAIHSV